MKLSPRMRELLAKASVVAEGPTAKIDPNKVGGHAKPGGMEPRGSSVSLGELMLREWDAARNEGERRRAERNCGEMLAAATHTKPPEQGLREPGSLPWKREIAAEVEKAQTGGDVVRIARKHSISRATAYSYRRLYGESEAA